MPSFDTVRELLAGDDDAFRRLGAYAWHCMEPLPTPGSDADTHAEMVAGMRRGLLDDGLGDLVEVVDLVLSKMAAVQDGMRSAMAQHWEAVHGPQPTGSESIADAVGTPVERPEGPRTMAGLVLGAEVHASGPAKAAADAAILGDGG